MAIQNVTVIGTGNMGAGIAQSFAAAGFKVTLHDVNQEAITRGIERIRKPLEKRVAEGKMAQTDLETLLARLVPEPDFNAAVGQADLVVEAVFEDLKVKQDLFARVDQAAAKHTILATNTSSFYVKDLAAVTQRPKQVVGLHYFFPAAINKLVEVVRGPQTSSETFEAAHDAVRRAGKLAIETSDAPGFCVNRFFVPWINEACRILQEGVADIPTIEEAAKKTFGITMGPFELMNVTGIPISLHAQTTLHGELGAFYAPAKILADQVAKKTPWDLQGPAQAEKMEAVATRLRGVVFGIATHLVDEGVASIRDTDRGATTGLRWKEGPFAMMNRMGLKAALADVEGLAAVWKDAFQVTKELRERAKNGTPWPHPAVRLEREGPILRLTFDRPEALNALSPNVIRDLEARLKDVEASLKGPDAPRVLIVTGEGKAFIAGADIPTMHAMDVKGAKAYTEQGNKTLSRLAGLPIPVIMAINGFAFGGGLELALAGDILVASDKAQLGLPEVGLGIHPGFGGTQRLARRIGAGKAKHLIFTGQTLDADTAYQLGIVDVLAPANELQDRVTQLAQTIAEKAPLAITGAKTSINRGLDTDLEAGLRIEQENVILLFASKDKHEGLSAFLEKRKPKFEGK